MKDFLKEAYDRLNQDTPIFFRKVGRLGVAAGAAGAAMITPDMAGAHIPAVITKIGGYLLTAGVVAKAVSHFACDTPPDQGGKP